MDKKTILKRLEAHFGQKPKYMGTPSFAYQIKARDEVYTIDREGIITNSGGKVVDLEELVGSERVVAVPELAKPDGEMELDGMEVVLPMEGHTGGSLKNLINMIAAKQSLIKQALGIINDLVDEEFIIGINEKATSTVGDFEAAALEIGTEKCPGVAFDFKERLITFKYHEGRLGPESLKAFTDLAAAINKTAQSLKHASSKPAATDNPKYSFRTWLLRLGMIGDEHKTTRKVLLKNLEGNGAFRKGEKESHG